MVIGILFKRRVLSGHHISEDAALFPELSARHPRLTSTIAKLVQDTR